MPSDREANLSAGASASQGWRPRASASDSEIDHQLAGERLEARAQVGEIDRRRVQLEPDREHLIAGHRGAPDLGLELLDVGAAVDQDLRDVAHDPRAIVAGDLELD